ncbi:hypothetical protein FPOAC1_012759 [Fusarium poae]|uniref:hypothetical protein n=1 Tax=Fusarium poae TaxID=36050 RepID=UPI001CEB89A9|nr:hypothetical protein FPOAC1_012759 [Fusarium poae]KAG8667918.1 hypothetical protein FPOAC1_012759 [Fusarium poae]
MTSAASSSIASEPICTSSSERLSENERFIDNEHDPLIPSLQDVHHTFQQGEATWKFFLSQAKAIPKGLWPKDALDPYVTLVDVPGLPANLPRRKVIRGRPCWEFSRDIGVTDCQSDTSLRLGQLTTFQLLIDDPIACAVGPDAASYACTNSETTESLAVLVMCWSYILSVRLFEMQGFGVRYTDHRLWPILPQDQEETTADINLKGASPGLIRWLCAILSPAMGWQARGHNHFPPYGCGCLHPPPSSAEAMELLIELCRLFNSRADSTLSYLEPMPPYKASFLAALALPFYRFMKLQPQLPRPHLIKRSSKPLNSAHKKQIRGYLLHIRYFMTLSAHPPSIGSILWSIFWQPDINCNLVGPWLGSVLHVLEPILVPNEVEVLLKVLVSRRPRIGIWWVSLFLLGDLALLDWIKRYTTRMEEKYGFGTLSSPDPMVSAWTGSKQSFLDFDNDCLYPKLSDLVSTVDLLRCRFDFKLQDTTSTALSWRPFGCMEKCLVELEIWPQLESTYTRRYSAFVWYPEKNFDKGFRENTGQHIMDVPDNLAIRTSIEQENNHPLNMRPSKRSTCEMIEHLVEDAGGSRNWANAGLPVLRTRLKWLHDWEGLDTMDGPVVEKEETRTPSWFLESWINGKFCSESHGIEESVD